VSERPVRPDGVYDVPITEILPKAQRQIVCGQCPFCRSKSIQGVRLTDSNGDPIDEFQLDCMICGASGPRGGSLAEATTKWNSRF
jgi:hypothetical protein